MEMTLNAAFGSSGFPFCIRHSTFFLSPARVASISARTGLAAAWFGLCYKMNGRTRALGQCKCVRWWTPIRRFSFFHRIIRQYEPQEMDSSGFLTGDNSPAIRTDSTATERGLAGEDSKTLAAF